MGRIRLRALLIATSMFGASLAKGDVNVLSWWGYIDKPSIDMLEKRCKTKISLDEFYSNAEFLRRWQAQANSYDVAIYSHTVHHFVDASGASKKADLRGLTRSYAPKFKAQYEREKLPQNTVYFLMSLTGFIWNPANIQISDRDSLEDIFARAKQKLVVLINDPVEINKLTSFAGKGQKKLTQQNREELLFGMLSGTRFLITNDIKRTLDDPSFAFAYTWSGEALNHIAARKDGTKFTLHPALSHVSKDFLALYSDKPEARCVAETLGSSSYIADMQPSTLYHSPYGKNRNIGNADFVKLEDYLFATEGPQLSWLESPSIETYKRLNTQWQKTKIKLEQKK